MGLEVIDKYGNKKAALLIISSTTIGSAINAISAGADLITSGTIIFSNSNGVSFGGNGQSITASVRTDYQSSGNYLTTAMLSNASTQFVQANAVFNGTNATGTIGSNGISISVAAPAGGGVALSGSNNSIISGTASFVNANGVSWSFNGQSISASVKTDYQTSGAYLTTAMLSNAGSNFVGLNSALTGNGISATINSSGISLNAPAFLTTAQPVGAYLTTAMLSNAGSNFVGLNSALTGNGVSATINSSGISLNVPAFITTAQPVGAYLTTAMLSNAGSNFVGLNSALTGNGISATINSSGISLDVPAFLTTAQAPGAYLTTARASNDAIGLNSALTANGVSVTANSSGLSLNFPAFLTTAQPVGVYLTTARASNDAIGLNTALTANGVSWTVNSSGLSLNVPAFLTTAQPVGAYLTTARASNDGVGLNTAQTNVTWTVNSSGISFNAGGYNGTGFTSTTTAGTAIVGTNNTAGLSIGVPAFITNALTTARASTDAVGLNTAQTNVTWTVNSSGLSFNAAGYAGTATTFAGQNISASMTLNSVGLNMSMGAGLMSYFAPPYAFSGMATNSSLGQSTVYFQPFDVPEMLSASRINFYVSLSGALSAGNSTGTCSVGIGYAIYTLNPNGTDSRTLNMSTSYSLVLISQSMTSNTVYAATHYAGLSNATSHTTSQVAISNANASTYQVSSVNGLRVVAMPLNVTMTPGRYWLAFSNQTVTGNAMTNGISVAITSVGVQPEIRAWGTSSAATNASVFRMMQGWGSYSAQTAAFPATIAFTTDNIRAGVAQTLIHFAIAGYSTSTNYM